MSSSIEGRSKMRGLCVNNRGVRALVPDDCSGQSKWSGNKAFQLLRVAREIPLDRRFLLPRADEKHQVRSAYRSTFETTAPASGVPTVAYDDPARTSSARRA